ncbi:MAG TPA: chorismate mutase [Thermoplasmata archaeon]|nr:chorismate mutase [Thermoplasmata archaeon]
MVRRHDTADPLESVRRDLARIDRAIVLLVAARIEAAVEAIRLRSQRDGRVASPAQEVRVLERARRWAVELGVSPEVIEVIFRAVIESGKERYRVNQLLPPRVTASRSVSPPIDRVPTESTPRRAARPTSMAAT